MSNKFFIGLIILSLVYGCFPKKQIQLQPLKFLVENRIADSLLCIFLDAKKDKVDIYNYNNYYVQLTNSYCCRRWKDREYTFCYLDNTQAIDKDGNIIDRYRFAVENSNRYLLIGNKHKIPFVFEGDNDVSFSDTYYPREHYFHTGNNTVEVIADTVIANFNYELVDGKYKLVGQYLKFVKEKYSDRWIKVDEHRY